ncbi:hypothetical protein PMAYCL1PPCAC_14000, partial [Pristionchus mayeri]
RCDVSYSQVCTAQHKIVCCSCEMKYIYVYHIAESLDNLKRDLSMSFEHSEQLAIRDVMFGIVESLHLTLHHLTDKRAESTFTKKSSKQADEINSPSLHLLPRPIEDPFYASFSIPGFDDTFDTGYHSSLVGKEDILEHDNLSKAVRSGNLDSMAVEIDNGNVQKGTTVVEKDKQVKKRKKTINVSSKSTDYLGYSDEDEVPLKKIAKSNSDNHVNYTII